MNTLGIKLRDVRNIPVGQVKMCAAAVGGYLLGLSPVGGVRDVRVPSLWTSADQNDAITCEAGLATLESTESGVDPVSLRMWPKC